MANPKTFSWLSKLIFSIINIVLVVLVVLSLALILKQVVFPTIARIQSAQQLFTNLKQTISAFAKFQTIEDLFDPQIGIIDRIDPHLDLATIQQAWTNFSTNINAIIKQLQQLDQNPTIFSTIKTLANASTKTLLELTTNLNVQFNNRGLVALATINDLSDQAEQLNQLASQWLNFNLDQIIAIFQAANATTWQVLLQTHFNQFATSRLFMMLVAIIIGLVCVLIIWLSLIIISCKVRIQRRKTINHFKLNLNIICNISLIFAPWSWALLKKD